MKVSHKFQSLSKKTKLFVAALTIGIVTIPIAAQAGFFPGRPAFDWNKYSGNNNCTDPANPARNQGRCGSMNGPVFNSFVNVPNIGDERAFLDGFRSDQTAPGTHKDVVTDVTKGSKEVVMRLYVHNNANEGTNASGLGVARNTKVRIELPTNEGNALRAVGSITADNATPKEVVDTVDMTSTEKFKVEYVTGSAKLFNNGSFLNGTKISDSIVAGGAPIGYSGLDGNLPGCFEFVSTVEIKVRIVPKTNPNLGFTKQVRKSTGSGQTGGWVSEVTAKPGEQVDWLLNTKNTGLAAMTDVITRDVLPPHVQLVPGSVKFTNAKGNQVLQDGPLFSGGFNAGRYDPNDNTLITFKTKLLDDFATCEVRVRNVAHAKSKEMPTEVTDDADVVIKKDNCKPTTPITPAASVTPTVLPDTGPGAVIATFVGVSSLSSGLYYIVHRRFGL